MRHHRNEVTAETGRLPVVGLQLDTEHPARRSHPVVTALRAIGASLRSLVENVIQTNSCPAGSGRTRQLP